MTSSDTLHNSDGRGRRTVPQSIMWVGTVRSLPLSEQLSTAASAGCDALSITPYDYTRWQLEGLSTSDMLHMAADCGVQLTHLDPLARWAPKWEPEDLDPAKFPTPFFGFTCDDFFRIAEALEVESLTAIVTCPARAVEFDPLVEAFVRLCDRAAEIGVRCDLEFIPLWGLPDLATAWGVVSATDRPNSGIIFDFWHYVRGAPDAALLASIPGHRISAVQVSDASAAIPPGRSMLDDCLFHRSPPGTGGFPVAELLRQLAAIGGLNRIGPEIFSADFDRLKGGDIGRLCKTSMAKVLDEAGIPHTFGG